MKEAIKCKCGKGGKMYCRNCSKVRMVILLKNGYDEMKITASNGNEYNPVWYSFLKYNRYDIYRIAEKMEQNFNKSRYKEATNVLQFYINGNQHQYFHKVVVL